MIWLAIIAWSIALGWGCHRRGYRAGHGAGVQDAASLVWPEPLP